MAAGSGEPRPPGPDDVIRLSLLDTRVTAAGLKEFHIFRNLECLWLDEVHLSPSASVSLARSRNSTGSRSPRSRLTDEFVRSLAAMKLLHTVALPVGAARPSSVD